MKKYTEQQILIAAEIGEVSMIDARHIVSLLDEAVNLERERKLSKHNVSGSLPCHHNFIQKDTYWKSCIHCGMITPLGQ